MKNELPKFSSEKELADWIGERVETMKPHATGVLLGIGLLVLIVLGSVWYFSGETASASRAWSQYFYAFNEREPQKVLQSLAAEQADLALGAEPAVWGGEPQPIHLAESHR